MSPYRGHIWFAVDTKIQFYGDPDCHLDAENFIIALLSNTKGVVVDLCGGFHFLVPLFDSVLFKL